MTASAGRSALWLSCHVDYQCRHSGACCRSGWPLPVEAAVVAEIDRAVTDHRISTVDGSPVWLVTTTVAPDDMAGTLRQIAGGCVFHAPLPAASGVGEAPRQCAVHATLGHGALPVSCQHFPRVCLVDDRGVRVTLSHACPTAATMLVEHVGPVSIVAGPPPVPGRAVPEGFDVRGELPPRLSSGVLADWPGLTAWEARVVDVLAGPGAVAGSAEAALSRLAADAERLAAWRPGTDTVGDVVASLNATAGAADGGARARPHPLATPAVGFSTARTACQAPWTWPEAPANLETLDAELVAAGWDAHATVVRRYLAAKAFAAWVGYQADATRALIAWLHMASAVLRVECVRSCAARHRPLDLDLLKDAIQQADRLLVHHADSAWLAAAVADG